MAVVNNGSGDVAVFARVANRLRFDKVVHTTSAPVSIDFGNDHMDVAGATTVDSFAITTTPSASLTAPPGLSWPPVGRHQRGSTAQVGVINDRRLIVTRRLILIQAPSMWYGLRGGAVSGAAPTAVSGPAGSLTPFRFAVYRDGTAVITLAHTNQDGLFRDGAFTAVIDAAGQLAPCWMTRAGKYVFSANTASRTLSRLIGTGSNVFVDKAVAASISTGSPTDIDGRRAGRHRSPRRAVAPFGVRAGCLWRSDARRRSDPFSDPECERDRADGAPPGLDPRPPNEGCDRATARLCHAVAAFDRHGGRQAHRTRPGDRSDHRPRRFRR